MNKETPWVVYKENKPYVLSQLKDGWVDYMDLTRWSFVDRYFAFLIASGLLDYVHQTYPDPRERRNIPVGFLIAAQLQMRLHGEAAYYKLPFILRSGSILTRVKYNLGLKGGGFNYRNRKEREAPIDQDTLRKYFKRSDAEKVEAWYNTEIAKWYKAHKCFDKKGVFILDPTYLVLPDNPNYKKAAWMPVDENGHIIDLKRLSEEEKKRVKRRLCYQQVLLLHLSEERNYFIFAGSHLGAGNESGLTEGEKLVDNFVERVGKGVIKVLIVDREYIDGPMITRFKRKHGIDVIVPLKKNMEALIDALSCTKLPARQSLGAGGDEIKWEVYKEERDADGKVVEKEEVVGVGDITSWENCEVPLYIVLVRKTTKTKDGEKVHIWALASTKHYKNPAKVPDIYKLRIEIEERIDQIKNCWLVGKFTSPDFNLDMAHVIFTLLTYSTIQIYLRRKKMQELTNRTITTLRMKEEAGKDAVIVCRKEKFATFNLYDFIDITLSLKGKPKQRLHRHVKEVLRKGVRNGEPESEEWRISRILGEKVLYLKQLFLGYKIRAP